MTMKANQAKHIGLRLKEFRKQAKMTQGELASAMGKSLRTIQGYESGTINLSLDVVERVAEVLGIPYHSLIVDSPEYLLHDTAFNQDEQLLLADYRILTPDLQIVVSEFVQHYRFHERSWDHPNLGVDDFYEIYRFIEYLCYKNCLNEKYYIDCRPVDEDGHPITEKEWNDY